MYLLNNSPKQAYIGSSHKSHTKVIPREIRIEAYNSLYCYWQPMVE